MAFLGSCMELLVDSRILYGFTIPTQCKSMVLPGSKVVRTVHGNATSFLLLFGFVFTKPEVLSSDVVPSNATSMGIYDSTVRVTPSASWNNPFGRRKRTDKKPDKGRFHRQHCKSKLRLLISDWPYEGAFPLY